MQETEKIWMNGELVDWADAKVHVGVARAALRLGRVRGDSLLRHRRRARRSSVSASTSSGSRARRGSSSWSMPYSIEELRAGDPRARRDQRSRVVLHPSDRVLRLQRARRRRDRQPDRRRDHELAVGRVPRRGQPGAGHHGDDLELGARRPERHPARREGDRRLPQLDARDDGSAPCRLRRGDHALARGYIADGPGETIFVVATGSCARRTSRRRSCPGITRHTVIEIARALGYTVEETLAHPQRPLPRGRGLHGRDGGRGDAGAVRRRPPYRRRPGHARAPEGLPGRRERPRRALDPTGSTSSRWRPPEREGSHPARRPERALGRRSRGGARRRGARVGTALARPDDRALRGGLRRGGRRAVRGGGLERDGGAPPALRRRGDRPGRRGRSRARTRSSRRRTARSTRARPRCSPTWTRGRSTSTRPRSRPRSRSARRPSSPSTSTATRASSTSCARSATGTASRSSRTHARRSAPGTRASRSARRARPPCSPSTPTSRSRRARAAWSRRTRRRSTGCSSSLRNQGRADGGGWLEHARLGFNYRIDDIRAAIGIGQLEKLDRDPRASGRRGGALRRAARGRRRGSSSPAPTTRITSARGSSTSSRCPEERIGRP